MSPDNSSDSSGSGRRYMHSSPAFSQINQGLAAGLPDVSKSFASNSSPRVLQRPATANACFVGEANNSSGDEVSGGKGGTMSHSSPPACKAPDMKARSPRARAPRSGTCKPSGGDADGRDKEGLSELSSRSLIQMFDLGKAGSLFAPSPRLDQRKHMLTRHCCGRSVRYGWMG